VEPPLLVAADRLCIHDAPAAHIMNLERGHHVVDGSGWSRQLAGSRDDGSAATRPHGGGGSTTLHLEQRAPPGFRPWSRATRRFCVPCSRPSTSARDPGPAQHVAEQTG
jgi:hypothetical protein